MVPSNLTSTDFLCLSVHPQIQREAKRAAKGSAGDLGYTGLSPTGLHELALLQHIAYCAAASAKGPGLSSSASGQGLGLAVPLAIASVSMTAETPSQDRRLVSLQPGAAVPGPPRHPTSPVRRAAAHGHRQQWWVHRNWVC